MIRITTEKHFVLQDMGKAGVYFLTVILFCGLSNTVLSQNNK